MKREFQIRIEDENNVLEECLVFTSLAEAQEHYNKMLEPEKDMSTVHLELIEVLRQDTVESVEKGGEDGEA